MPFISIIIPTYNSAVTLSDALESILQQSYTDFEILLVDGLSSDETLKIAEGINDNRIRISSEIDLGIYHAMNKGIELSRGEWIYFMGSDDKLANNRVLEDLLQDLNSEIDFLYGNVIWGDEGTVYDGTFDLEKLIRFKNICQQAIFYKKELFVKLGLFSIEFKYCADHYFNILCFTAGVKIKYVNKIVAEYNKNGRSSQFGDVDFQKKRTLLIIEKFENPIEVYDKFLKYKQQIKLCENSKEYKLGRILLSPLRFFLRLTYRSFN